MDARPGQIVTLEYEKRRIQQVLAIYEDAQSRIRDQLTSGDLSSFDAGRLRILRAQIKAEVDKINRNGVAVAKGAVGEIYAESARNAAARINSMGVGGSINLGSRLNTRTVNAIAEAIAADLVYAGQDTLRQVNTVLNSGAVTGAANRLINREIGVGVATGDTLGAISRRVESVVANSTVFDGHFVRAGNRTLRLSDYAELVVRTRMREAASQAAIMTSLEFGLDLVQVSVHEHPQLDPCSPFIGRVYSISGSHPDFPPLDRTPPFHPNCRHVLLPITEDAMEADGEYDSLSRLSNQNRPDRLTRKSLESWASKDVTQVTSYRNYRDIVG